MLHHKQINFRNKLFIWFVLISIVPLTLVSILVYRRVAQDYRNTLTTNFDKQASITKQNVLYFLESHRSHIQSLAAQDILLSEMQRYVDASLEGFPFAFDPDGIIFSTLVSVRRENNFIEKVYIVDTTGKILISTATNDVGSNISSEDLFIHPVSSRSTYVGRVKQHNVDRIIPLSSPFLRKNNNQVMGLLVIELNASIIKALFDGSLILQTSSTAYDTEGQKNAYVIDDDGFVLSLTQMPQVDSFPQKQCVSYGSDQTGEWLGIHGEKVYGVSKCVRVSDFAWTLLVEQPVHEAFVLSQELTKTIALVIFVVTVLLLLITIAVSRSVTRPIRHLIAGVEKLGKGQLWVPIEVSSRDEFGNLATSFNQMAEQLKSLIYNLTAERNKLEVILSGVRDAVIAVDLVHNIILFNIAAETLTGYRAEDIIGRKLSDVIHIFDTANEISVHEYCPIRKDDTEGTIFSQRNVKVIGKEGHIAYVNIITGKIKEGVNSNLGGILTLHDITEEQQLEKMKVDFVSMAAHELRTPLTAIKGYAQLLRESIAPQLVPDQQLYIDRLVVSTQNLGDLIENLLNVSRIEKGTFKVELGPVNITDTLTGTIETFKQIASTKNQTLSYRVLCDPLPLVIADKSRIGQVLSNLLANAMTYTPPEGQISIIVEKQDVSNLVITVKDTGQGIPPEALPKLFTKFFRVSGTLEKGSKGTGLGLYISKSIIDMHHGRIWVESELNRGTSFYFTLPLADPNAVPASPSDKHGFLTEKRGIILNKDRLKHVPG